MTEEELRQHIKATAKPQILWGKQHGIEQSVISRVVNGLREPPDSLLKALGLKRITSYEPIRKRHKEG